MGKPLQWKLPHADHTMTTTLVTIRKGFDSKGRVIVCDRGIEHHEPVIPAANHLSRLAVSRTLADEADG